MCLPSEWVAGFSTGESNFFIAVQKSKTKSGLAVSLRFSVAQHSRDLLLLESLINFFNCGYIVNYEKRLLGEFVVAKIDHIIEHIIPFFEKHPAVWYRKSFKWDKLSNSGDILKLMVPDFIMNLWKEDWSTLRVTIQRMTEKEIDDRGSKSSSSDANSSSIALVKEQRADGSWHPTSYYKKKIKGV